MRPIALLIVCSTFAGTTLSAGQEQAFFLATVRQATSVKIEKDSGREANGAIAWKILLQSGDPQKIRDVVATIEMEDAKPIKSNGEDTWKGSGLTFGVPDCTIIFFHGDKKILEYWLEASPTSITAAGPRANYGPDIMMALPLTGKSALALQRMISSLERMPNQLPEPTLALGTSPAVQEPRHP